MRHDNFIPQPRLVKIHSRGRLPHWEVDQAVYFVTFRLADSLPAEIARRLILERQQAVLKLSTAAERARLDEAFAIRLDRYLDEGHGSCLLRDHAETVANALRFFDRLRYELHAWCVMPNHVHVLFYLERGRDLDRVLHSWKSFTAHVIGKGVIWQREYFDRVVRSPAQFNETRSYIQANPAKAGLRNWPWVG
jgi:REP element-mobilizing transposase RayT